MNYLNNSNQRWYHRAKSAGLWVALGAVLSALSATAYAAVYPKCYIFVHGRNDDGTNYTSYQAAYNYWVGKNTNLAYMESGSFVGNAIEQIRSRQPGSSFYVVGYDSKDRGYMAAAVQVANHLANAMQLDLNNPKYSSKNPAWKGYPFGGGKDGGGNGCPANSTFIVVAHSMGGPVMDYILGNAVPGAKRYNNPPDPAPFGAVVAKIQSVHVIAGAHRGTQAANAAMGNDNFITNLIAKFITKPSESANWLQTHTDKQVAGYMGSPIKPIYLYSGYEAMASSPFLPGEDDGVIPHSSGHACSDGADVARNLKPSSMNKSIFNLWGLVSTKGTCNDSQHMTASGFYNRSSADENHQDNARGSDPQGRVLMYDDSKRATGSLCGGKTSSSTSSPQEIGCFGI